MSLSDWFDDATMTPAYPVSPVALPGCGADHRAIREDPSGEIIHGFIIAKMKLKSIDA
jgi:hypothetical protein